MVFFRGGCGFRDDVQVKIRGGEKREGKKEKAERAERGDRKGAKAERGAEEDEWIKKDGKGGNQQRGERRR